MLAQAARTEDVLPPETQQTVLRTRINACIRQHLADPGLTPASIAAAHQISVRYLHKLYQSQGTTIADGIRRTRLEHIHRDLADPRLNARSISSIAARWGFPEPTTFSRAFKTLYGITPRDRRQQTQHGSGTLKGSYNLKNAPYAACDNVAYLGSNTLIYFHCWAQNDFGNWWVYGRVQNTQTLGWMSVDNFSSYTSGSSAGSKPRCNLN